MNFLVIYDNALDNLLMSCRSSSNRLYPYCTVIDLSFFVLVNFMQLSFLFRTFDNLLLEYAYIQRSEVGFI